MYECNEIMVLDNSTNPQKCIIVHLEQNGNSNARTWVVTLLHISERNPILCCLAYYSIQHRMQSTRCFLPPQECIAQIKKASSFAINSYNDRRLYQVAQMYLENMRAKLSI